MRARGRDNDRVTKGEERGNQGYDGEREEEKVKEKTRKKEPHEREGCEKAEKRVVSEGGTREWIG